MSRVCSRNLIDFYTELGQIWIKYIIQVIQSLISGYYNFYVVFLKGRNLELLPLCQYPPKMGKSKKSYYILITGEKIPHKIFNSILYYFKAVFDNEQILKIILFNVLFTFTQNKAIRLNRQFFFIHCITNWIYLILVYFLKVTIPISVSTTNTKNLS